MSAALYAARLYWVGLRGTAHVGAAHVRLTHPPHLPGLRVDGVDYIPEIRLRQVMPYAERWRDMTDAEAAAAHALLHAITTAGHDHAAPHA